MRILTGSVLVIAGLSWWMFSGDGVEPAVTHKMNGVSLVSPRQQISQEQMSELKHIHAQWVAIIPFAFAQSGVPQIIFNHERQWWGERTDGTCELIQMAKENGMKVMLKPHVWVRGESWPGDFDLESEQEWKEWEIDYAKYMLHFAALADSLGVELFCIGTEFRVPARERPDYWRNLIGQVKKVYSGKITYAANWDDYQDIIWWNELDFIGIDAYFPLSEEIQPTVSTLIKEWQPISKELSSFAEKWDKKILFTEYGFQSVDAAAGKHWEAKKSVESVNNQLQADAYEATFQALVDQEWYAGGFFWKWYFFQRSGEQYLTDWTPQGKPAEQVISKWYGLTSNLVDP